MDLPDYLPRFHDPYESIPRFTDVQQAFNYATNEFAKGKKRIEIRVGMNCEGHNELRSLFIVNHYSNAAVFQDTIGNLDTVYAILPPDPRYLTK